MPQNKSTIFVEERAVGNELADGCFQEKVACLCVLTDEAMIMIRRICEAKQAGDKVIDVDGSYLWRQY